MGTIDGRSDGTFNSRPGTESILDRFEHAWISGNAPSLRDFMESSTTDRDLLLVELALLDLEYRFRADKSIRIECYLESFPVLRDDPAHLLELIKCEYRLRKQASPDLTIQDYRDRFGSFANEVVGDFEKYILECSSSLLRSGLEIRHFGLLLLNGPRKGIVFLVPYERPLLVGRGIRSDTNLDDPFLSREHFAISRCQNSFVLCRLATAGGVLVNGSATDEYELKSMDIIQAGSTLMRFQVVDPEIAANSNLDMVQTLPIVKEVS